LAAPAALASVRRLRWSRTQAKSKRGLEARKTERATCLAGQQEKAPKELALLLETHHLHDAAACRFE
jgi:hypothetical protein